MDKKNKGFTLAEVLITLVIIGVIASMTIPTLMNNTNKQELVSKLKKVYSEMSQVTNRIIAEEGNPKADIGGWATSSEAVYNQYKKYLNKAKDCGTGTECFEKMTSGNTFYKNLNGTNYFFSIFTSNQFYKMILADGTQVFFDVTYNNCTKSNFDTNNICSLIWVDINGEKKPNQWGRDIFIFIIQENGLVPAGCDGNSSDCTTSKNGYTCACKVIKEGAFNY